LPQIDAVPIEDVDGAFEAALEEAGGVSRRRLLLGGGALAAGGVVFGGFAPRAGAVSRRQDLTILQFALVAEYLGSSFYTEALAAGRLTGPTLAYAQAAKRDEDEHVTFVRAAIRGLGGTPRPRPAFDFKGIPADPARFGPTALTIETMCVRVLNGAGPHVTKPTLRGAARLVSVEARQVAWISLILGKSPAPGVTDQPLSLATAQQRVAETGFIVPD
jgi:Ferritin-like domain